MATRRARDFDGLSVAEKYSAGRVSIGERALEPELELELELELGQVRRATLAIESYGPCLVIGTL